MKRPHDAFTSDTRLRSTNGPGARRHSVAVFLPRCAESIGEQIVQLPFFHFLRRLHPEANIVAVSAEKSSFLLETFGAVDRTVSLDRGTASFQRCIRELRGDRFGEAFVLPRHSFRSNLAARAAAGYSRTSGFHQGVNRFLLRETIPWNEIYIGENYTRLLGRSVAEFAAETADEVPNAGGQGVVIIPGGLRAQKRYPIESYLRVAVQLRERFPVRFLVGPADERDRRAIESSGHGFPVHAGEPLVPMAKRIRGAALVIANDCGPAHFAHIHDIPRISLFHRSITLAPWYREGRRGHLLRPRALESLSTIAPETVTELGLGILARPAAGLVDRVAAE